jgi:hypothetical protein
VHDIIIFGKVYRFLMDKVFPLGLGYSGAILVMTEYSQLMETKELVARS